MRPPKKTSFLAEIFPKRRIVEFTVALTNIPGALEAVAVNHTVSSQSSPRIKNVKEMQKTTEKLLLLESNAYRGS